MKILMTGGGTGGHIYPALAFIHYVQKVDPTCEFMYVGAKRGLENKIIPKTGIPYAMLEIQGFKRSLSLDNVKTLQLFFKSVGEGKKILKQFKPDVVIGTGGYVSGAMVYAASRLKIPTVIHEQNSVPGMTNKFLARFVNRVAITFPDVATYFPKEKVVLTGNPRASEVEKTQNPQILESYHLQPDKKTVLIFGGSQGARKINEGVKEALAGFAKENYQVLYATGERYFSTFNEEKIPENVKVVPYIENMMEVLGNVDVLVGRAGATSIAEFTALGLPAILIPSPYVTNDHQRKNAESLVKVGAVKMIADADFSGTTLLKTLDGLLENPETLVKMGTAAKKEGQPDAAKKLYQVVGNLVK